MVSFYKSEFVIGKHLLLFYSLRYAKDRENEQQIKSAEFRAAKKVEEEALMTALGMKIMPPPGFTSCLTFFI
jgi:uncharacterized protein HemY